MPKAYLVIRTSFTGKARAVFIALGRPTILPISQAWRDIPNHPLLTHPTVKYNLSPSPLFTAQGTKFILAAGVPKTPDGASDATVQVMGKPMRSIQEVRADLCTVIAGAVGAMIPQGDMELRWTASTNQMVGRATLTAYIDAPRWDQCVVWGNGHGHGHGLQMLL